MQSTEERAQLGDAELIQIIKAASREAQRRLDEEGRDGESDGFEERTLYLSSRRLGYVVGIRTATALHDRVFLSWQDFDEEGVGIAGGTECNLPKDPEQLFQVASDYSVVSRYRELDTLHWPRIFLALVEGEPITEEEFWVPYEKGLLQELAHRR